MYDNSIRIAYTIRKKIYYLKFYIMRIHKYHTTI